MEEWLSGHSLGILALSSFEKQGVPLDIFWQEAPCSKPTAYKVLIRLGSAGVLAKDAVSIRTADKGVETFANDYATNLVNIATSPVKLLKVSIRVRLHVIVRAEGEAPKDFSPTGISVLFEHGLEAMRTSYNDYYFNLSGKQRKIGVEEAFAHALLFEQDSMVLALFLMKNKAKMNIARLRALARQYGVAEKLATMRDALDYAEKAV